MKWIGMGKVSVGTPGTPVPLASDPNTAVKVDQVKFAYDPADGSHVIYVKDRAGNVMLASNSPNIPPLSFESYGTGDQLDLRDFQVDADTGGAGPFVSYATR